ncbi:hypothetical protein [Paenibacillus sp. 32352]|uniref:hypothetical protein n=1 Tax=Paenibacillus sp. 32352 TaxID=1969111 RepID=UPI0009AC6A0E|nr:hypothetical protein [Paenibacillus sp. 32352]
MSSRKKTTEQFKSEVYALVEGEYEVVGEYIYALAKISMRHNTCGRNYEVTPAHFLTGNRCPFCSGKYRTTDDYSKIVNDLTNDEYKVLGEYTKASAKVSMKHIACGNEFLMTPNSFMGGQRCPNCPLKRDEARRQFEERVRSLVGDEYEFLSPYEGVDSKVKMKHVPCGNEYLANPSGFLRGERCPSCARLSRTRTVEQVKEEIDVLVGNEYFYHEPSKTHVMNTDKITITHNICGHTYEVLLSNFLRGTRCPQCSKASKLTHDEFLLEIRSLVGDEYSVLGQYKGRSKKIEFRHNICGHAYVTTPMSFVTGARCIPCGIKARSETPRKSHEQIIKEIHDLVGDEYSLVSQYQGIKEKLTMKHNSCGYEYKVSSNHFFNGTRCPSCFGKNKKSTEGFINEVQELVGEEYRVLGEYKNARTKIEMQHMSCGYHYSIVPDSFLRGTRCPACYGKIKKNTEIIKKEIFQLVGNEYTVLGQYVNSGAPLLIRHNTCGNEYETRTGNFLKGYRCGACANNQKKTTESFILEVRGKFDDEYEILGEYIDSRSLISVRHTACGFEYSITPDNLLRGKGCFYCNRMSQPEKDLYHLLLSNSVNFEMQKEFNDLQHDGKLRFDYCIYLGEGKDEFVLIEYDGLQHYKPVFGEESFSKTKMRDELKVAYCQQHNIPLKRIPYYKNHVKSLANFLETFGFAVKIPEQLRQNRASILQH